MLLARGYGHPLRGGFFCAAFLCKTLAGVIMPDMRIHTAKQRRQRGSTAVAGPDGVESAELGEGADGAELGGQVAAEVADGAVSNNELERLRAELAQSRREASDAQSQVAQLQSQLEALQVAAQAKPQASGRQNSDGYRLLEAFVKVTPYLRRFVGRGFVIAVSREFDYRIDPDIDQLNEIQRLARERDPEYHDFRDTYREGHGIRLIHTHTSTKQEFFQTTPDGRKMKTDDYMMPATMENGGLEIASDHKTAMYKVIKTGEPSAVAVPRHVLGIPLYSQAFPVFDDEGVLIGGVSFAVEIDAILDMAQELGRIEGRDEDSRLNELADVLRNELESAGVAAMDVKQESVLSQRTAQKIRDKGIEVIDIAEQLNVLAINTAIEASKVGESGRGVGVIAGKMKEISSFTQAALKEIHEESTVLDNAAKKVIERAEGLVAGSGNLKQELSVLSEVSGKITTQKDELATLVRSSIENLTASKEDLSAVYSLLDK